MNDLEAIIKLGGYDFPCQFWRSCVEFTNEIYCRDDYEECLIYQKTIKNQSENELLS